MFQNVTQEAKRQRKNFNQRVSYWIKQGLTLDEASRLALVREHMIGSAAPCNELYPSTSERSLKPPQRTMGQIFDFPKSQNNSPSENSVSQDFSSDLIEGTKSICSLKIRWSDFLEQVFCLFMVVGTSVILIKASWQIFGQGWEGFLKAFLLEVGILTLAVYQGRNILSRLFSKAGAIVLACLSLFVLHTGIEGEKGDALKSVVEADAELATLKAQRESFLRLQGDLPSDHLKRREMLLGAVTDLTSKIEKAKTEISGSHSVKTVKDRYALETLVRIALMFLGTIFAHHLVRRIKEVDFWGIGGMQALAVE